MRVIFFGTSEFAVPTLEQLVSSGQTVAMCVTQPDRPQGRGLSAVPSPIKRAALRFGVPLAQPERVQATPFHTLQPEVGVVVAYGQLIRRDLLELPRHGMLGVHPSLLPRYRGAAPVAWAILSGEPTTGVTIFRLSEALDAGDVLSRREAPIEPGEDAQALTTRLAHIGAQELVRGLEALASGRATFEPQNPAHASLAPKLTKAQGRIDWSQPAEAIERLVRATIPWPGASTEWQGAVLKVWSVAVGAGATGRAGAPGTVVEVSSEAVSVATGRGLLEVKEVQPAGRRRMRMKEFLAGHPLRVGDRFGSGSSG